MDGAAWSVRETRASGHGWTIYLGRPYPPVRRQGGHGGTRVILTAELRDYLRAHLPKDYALPIGRTAIKRLRRALGLHAPAERYAWWLDRIDDLGALTAAEFVAKHPAPARTGRERMVILRESTVSMMRQQLLGRALRPVGWWRAPDIAAVLTSQQPAREIAGQLDIATSSVRRLRALLTTTTTTDA